MRSFEHGYLLEQPISQTLLMTAGKLGEYRGRQELYRDQSPKLLETLKRVAIIQSIESPNRIEGVTVAADRLEAIVTKKSTPKGHSEQEVAGYRDVLADIHTNASRMSVSPELILRFHRQMYARTPEKGGRWKNKDNAILEVLPEGRQVVRFRPVSALATPEFIKKLCLYYHRMMDQREAEPLLLVASFIFDFECIHPFWDGNGRIGRLLTLLSLSSARGAKREPVQQAVKRLPDRFRFSELQHACPGVSYPPLKRALADLRRQKKLRCLGKGRDAEWERIGS